MKRLTLLSASLLALPLLALSAATPAFAQENKIIGGLCEGAELEFTDNPSADCRSDGGDATEKINRFVKQIINLLSALVGIVAVIMIIVGGLRYITSGGNDQSVTSAKNTILYAIIGLIIVALAQVLVRFTLSKIANP